MKAFDTRCCIVGGGPAGMVAGYLLARYGVDVVVLEKHGDFLRDFRGDTIHPSTLELMHELGLLDALLTRSHSEVPFLEGEARELPNFRLAMHTEATELIENDGVVRGVRGHDTDGEIEIRADLTIAADGRHSHLRQAAGFERTDLGAPMDVMWLRLARRADEQSTTFGRIGAGTMFIMLDRGDYWQCALVIRKGSGDAIKARGIEPFRDLLARASDMPRERFAEIADVDDAKLLTVAVDRLKQWAKPGLLCIGDCAHAMSPVGGVGINLAIQDAVAAANLLAQDLRTGAAPLPALHKVQARREFAVRATQKLQIFVQRRVIGPTLERRGEPKLPLLMRLFSLAPILQRIPARIIGLGMRPEHVDPALLTRL